MTMGLEWGSSELRNDPMVHLRVDGRHFRHWLSIISISKTPLCGVTYIVFTECTPKGKENPRRTRIRGPSFGLRSRLVPLTHGPGMPSMAIVSCAALSAKNPCRTLIFSPLPKFVFGRSLNTVITKPNQTKPNQTPWSESVSELYRPSDRRSSAK
jgi:hypothetical protein